MFAKDIGIDLGTANVLIYIKGQGIVLNEPSIVVIDSDTKKMLACGKEAKEMLGRTPGNIQAIRPMKDGVIADFEVTEMMLNNFIRKVNGKSFLSRPRILICCPSNITQVEKNDLPFIFLIKLLSITSVISKSAITPSFIGLIAFTVPGVLPNISLASCPTAKGFFVSASIATILGSFKTIP